MLTSGRTNSLHGAIDVQKKKVQLGFRVTEAFQKHIEGECLARNLSLQSLVTDALKLYFQFPRKNWATAQAAIVTFDDDARQQQKQTKLWLTYINEMPPEKVRLLEDVMKMDLRHYRSSRRKAKAKRTETRQTMEQT
jgi:hypothetical protein